MHVSVEDEVYNPGLKNIQVQVQSDKTWLSSSYLFLSTSTNPEEPVCIGGEQIK